MHLEIDPQQIRPYYDSLGDGMLQLSFTLPLPAGPLADRAAKQMLERMQLTDIALVERRSIAADMTFFIAYARITFSIDSTALDQDTTEHSGWSAEDIEHVKPDRFGRRLVVIGATLESDAHTVGLDAIFNPKGYAGHPGLEHYACFKTFNLGAQVPFHQLIDAVRRRQADAVLISQTITQKGLHMKNLTRMVDLLEAEGLRDPLLLIVGGPNITPELAKELGYDAGFGRNTYPQQVAGFILDEMMRRQNG